MTVHIDKDRGSQYLSFDLMADRSQPRLHLRALQVGVSIQIYKFKTVELIHGETNALVSSEPTLLKGVE